MPKLKTGTIKPTRKESTAITAAALRDPDAAVLSDQEWAEVKPRIGRPPSRRPLKVATTIRLDPDVLSLLRASGRGWQTRINTALRDWLKVRQKA